MWLPTKWTWSHAEVAMWYVWNTVYITYHAGLCARIRWPCPWKTNMRKTGPHWYGDNLIIDPRFIISGTLWFKALRTVDSISGSGVMLSLCSIRWLFLAILPIFKHCPYFDSQCSVPVSHWCLDQCMVSQSLIVPDHLIVARSSWGPRSIRILD